MAEAIGTGQGNQREIVVENTLKGDCASNCFYVTLTATLYCSALVFNRAPELFMIFLGAASEYLIVDTLLEFSQSLQVMNLMGVFIATIGTICHLVYNSHSLTMRTMERMLS